MTNEEQLAYFDRAMKAGITSMSQAVLLHRLGEIGEPSTASAIATATGSKLISAKQRLKKLETLKLVKTKAGKDKATLIDLTAKGKKVIS